MRKRYRTALWVLLGIVAVLIILRVALPYIVLGELNGRMAHMGKYEGHVADVDIHLWRGAYSLDGLRVTKVSGKVPVPLLKAPRMEVILSWRALTHGHIRARVEFEAPVLNFVDGSGNSDTQSGTGVDWRQQLQKLVPIRLDEVNVHDGTITFQNFVSNPRVDLKMTDVQAKVTNLTNANRAKGSRVATLDAHAKVLGDAPLTISASFDPLERFGDFTFKLRVLHVQLKKANDLARAYVGLDFSSGTGDFVMELHAKGGKLNGYAKPLFHDLQIFSWKQDVEKQHENPIGVAWEALAQGVTWIFSNHAKQQFATRVPISGSVDNKSLSPVRSILNVLRNAFVKAYTPQLEHLKPAPAKGH